jgi:hypothetical protein
VVLFVNAAQVLPLLSLTVGVDPTLYHEIMTTSSEAPVVSIADDVPPVAPGEEDVDATNAIIG